MRPAVTRPAEERPALNRLVEPVSGEISLNSAEHAIARSACGRPLQSPSEDRAIARGRASSERKPIRVVSPTHTKSLGPESKIVRSSYRFPAHAPQQCCWEWRRLLGEPGWSSRMLHCSESRGWPRRPAPPASWSAATPADRGTFSSSQCHLMAISAGPQEHESDC